MLVRWRDGEKERCEESKREGWGVDIYTIYVLELTNIIRL